MSAKANAGSLDIKDQHGGLDNIVITGVGVSMKVGDGSII